MTANGWFQVLLFFAIIFAVTKPLGLFLARVFSGERTFLDPVLRPVERMIYRLTRVDQEREGSTAGPRSRPAFSPSPTPSPAPSISHPPDGEVQILAPAFGSRAAENDLG